MRRFMGIPRKAINLEAKVPEKLILVWHMDRKECGGP